MPPHVFAVDRARLRYARFERAGEAHHLRQLATAELGAEVFGSGPLGGTLREPGRLRDALGELVDRLPSPVSGASLVVPDRWLRVTFAEVEELPRGSRARIDVLRWKLQRLVPFRVDELRVAGRQVTSREGQEGSHRVLLGFAIEQLLAQLEEAFTDRGIHLGHISSESLCLGAAVEEALRGVDLGAFALVRSDGYSLVFVWRQELYLHRYRSLDLADGGGSSPELILRDLRLTRAFLEEQLPEVQRGRVLLICPPGMERDWLGWLEQTMGLPAFLLGREHLALGGQPGGEPVDGIAPLLGAARQVVA